MPYGVYFSILKNVFFFSNTQPQPFNYDLYSLFQKLKCTYICSSKFPISYFLKSFHHIFLNFIIGFHHFSIFLFSFPKSYQFHYPLWSFKRQSKIFFTPHYDFTSNLLLISPGIIYISPNHPVLYELLNILVLHSSFILIFLTFFLSYFSLYSIIGTLIFLLGGRP